MFRILILLGFSWVLLFHASPVWAGGDLSQLGDAMYKASNGAREGHHLMALARDPVLDQVALAHSQDMAERGYFSHETPEGLNPLDRIQNAGVSGFSLAAENVGLTSQQNPTQQILHGWLQSPPHRKNLLAPAFNTTGVGVARSSNGSLYYTQIYVTILRNGD